jgi:hypothetical protein
MEATPFRSEPVIDLTRSTSPSSLRLNLQAEDTIMTHRELMHARRHRDLADRATERIRVGFDYTPGVGWHTSDPPSPCKPTVHVQSDRPQRRWHGDVPADDGFDSDDGVYTAVFTDVRTGEQTHVCDDGTIPVGNALDSVPYRDFSGLVRHTFVPLIDPR